MRIISSSQAPVVGVLGIVGMALMGATVFVMKTDKVFVVLGSIGAVAMLELAYFGLFSKWVAFDQAYMILRKGDKYERYLLSEVTKVRTIPYFWYMGVLWITHASGKRVFTVVADEDLTWIMSQVPLKAITPFWRRKLG
jgi:hypothetical protein